MKIAEAFKIAQGSVMELLGKICDPILNFLAKKVK